MIQHLKLKNVAIIEALTLDFRPGFTVLTGEAGAGKSLLLDSLGWALGAPLSPIEVLRSGTQHASIELELKLDDAQRQFLGKLLTLDLTEELFNEPVWTFTREVTPTGSRCRVNGLLVQRKALQPALEAILMIQGQHSAIGLLQPAQQRLMLDAFGGEALLNCARQVKASYSQWQQAQHAYEEACQSSEAAIALRKQQTEDLALINAAMPITADEDTRLQHIKHQQANADKLLSGVAKSLAALQPDLSDRGETAAFTALERAEKALSAIISLDEKTLGPVLEQIAEAHEVLRDAARHLSGYSESVTLSPNVLRETIDRLDTLDKLKRRFGPDLESVLKTHAELEALLNHHESPEARLNSLKIAAQNALTALQQHAAQLSELRASAAKALESRMTTLLHQLTLPAANFRVELSPCTLGAQGQEHPRFMFSANAGEPLRPIAQVASGGELSRLLLALSVIMSQNPLQTQGKPSAIIFDEIDTGTSGITARAIASQLVQLSHQQAQVLVITHQPIIAAAADWHMHLEKSFAKLATGTEARTSVVARWLTQPEQREQILGQLASGDRDAASARQYAAGLLQSMRPPPNTPQETPARA
ncbi:MAG: AAA family ATPase [Vampirovibrionales bacterium]|nr:AAA family ATPase [Vampirovibrionales bacterium]